LAATGVNREFAPDRLQPPNLAAFFGNLPRPERDRLLGLAYPAAATAAVPPAPAKKKPEASAEEN